MHASWHAWPCSAAATVQHARFQLCSKRRHTQRACNSAAHDTVCFSHGARGRQYTPPLLALVLSAAMLATLAIDSANPRGVSVSTVNPPACSETTTNETRDTPPHLPHLCRCSYLCCPVHRGWSVAPQQRSPGEHLKHGLSHVGISQNHPLGNRMMDFGVILRKHPQQLSACRAQEEVGARGHPQRGPVARVPAQKPCAVLDRGPLIA